MVEAISEQEGMVDKFIGDAIMAGFGVPIAHEDDEDRAVRAAINMIKGCANGTSKGNWMGSYQLIWASV